MGQIYCCTETAPIAIVLLKEDAATRVGSAGKPAMHCEVKIVAGEIWVRGPNVMRRYWNDLAATAAVLDTEGWLRTGDLARLDEDVYYWMLALFRDRLARYKHPRRVVFADGLPKNALGRVQKHELKKLLQQFRSRATRPPQARPPRNAGHRPAAETSR